tara:strand:+ start:488 stop:619 length:132 start_codon:yes stop_codon:yes gene_type:complete
MNDKPKKKRPRWFIPLDKVFNIYESDDAYYKGRLRLNILNEDK